MQKANPMFSRFVSLSLLLMHESSQEHSKEKCGSSCEGCWKQLMAKDLWTFAYTQYSQKPKQAASPAHVHGGITLKPSESKIKTERRFLDGLILSNIVQDPVYARAS